MPPLSNDQTARRPSGSIRSNPLGAKRTLMQDKTSEVDVIPKRGSASRWGSPIPRPRRMVRRAMEINDPSHARSRGRRI
jgi:hypothetical protein